MASYLFLTPPQRAEGDERTVAIRDGFAPLAFLFPTPWLLVHRLWFEAAASALLLAGAILAVRVPALALPGAACGLAICLLAGLEARNLAVRGLERRGFTLAAAIEARNRAEAEEIFFSRAALRTRTPGPSAIFDQAPTFARPAGSHGPVLGLFDLHGGR